MRDPDAHKDGCGEEVVSFLIRIPRPVCSAPPPARTDADRQRERPWLYTPLGRLRACILAPTSIGIADMDASRGCGAARTATSERATGAMVESSNTASGRSWRKTERQVREKCAPDGSYSGPAPQDTACASLGGRMIRRAPGDEEGISSIADIQQASDTASAQGSALQHIALACTRPPSPTLWAQTQQRLLA
ncbi:hypothetical protein B0H17DRAFT_1216067 [Mycena rosella]|uniref:Uncharacterized protein n=1 Tax=Mycena rosella TaxID=1033263 RepID=A0AAD7CEU0_MYCRO|nr:hypothetical protein B0H17DRAFT_1216067 [Mycena rosella]